MSGRKATLFWKLEQPDSGQVSYLLGTWPQLAPTSLSILKNRLSHIPCPNRWSALDDHPASTRFMPGDQTLDQLLSNRHFTRIAKILKKAFQLDLETCNRYYPLAVVDLLADRLSADEGLVPVNVNLPADIRPLEGVAATPRFSAIPIEFQLRQLRALANQPARFRQKMHKTVQERSLEDPVLIWRKTRERLSGPERKRHFARNGVLTGLILSEATQKPSLFLINATALGGGKGILRRLKAAGMRLSACNDPTI